MNFQFVLFVHMVVLLLLFFRLTPSLSNVVGQVVRLLGLSNDLWVLLGVVLTDGVVDSLFDLRLHFALLGLELSLGALSHRQWPAC